MDTSVDVSYDQATCISGYAMTSSGAEVGKGSEILFVSLEMLSSDLSILQFFWVGTLLELDIVRSFVLT